MKKITVILFTALFLLAGYACNENEMFDKELYEKKIYIVSNDDKVFSLEYELGNEAYTAHFSISYSGTKRIDRDVVIEFTEDSVLFEKYNYSNYDIDSAKYAHLLSPELYKIPSYKATLSPENENTYVNVPIVINTYDLEGLSPDSIYFISLKLTNVSTYEINEEKDDVLCRIYFKNEYAGIKEDAYYAMKGSTEEEGKSEIPVSTSKILLPLTANSVRSFAGLNAFKEDLDFIRSASLILQVNEDHSITIKPYHETIEVEQLTPPDDPDFLYTNEYEEKDQRFKLYYRFRSYNIEEERWSTWNTVKEILRRMDTDN